MRQGVTTVMVGVDGRSPVPLRPFLTKLEALPKSVNVGAFIGQGSIREAVIGEVDRPAATSELDKMRALVEQDMKDGALGLSSGLFYVPGIFTPSEEVIELAKVAGRIGGHYNSHMRDEASRVVESVRTKPSRLVKRVAYRHRSRITRSSGRETGAAASRPSA